MASTINANTTTGLVESADLSGVLQLQANGVTQATISSAGFSAPGTVLQVQAVTTTTMVSTTSSSFTATGLTASITPKFSTSKILVLVSMGSIENDGAGSGVNLNLYRNSTSLESFGIINGYWSNGTTNAVTATVTSGGSALYLDSPATTASTTYSVSFASNNNSSNVKVQANGAASNMILMEIAA